MPNMTQSEYLAYLAKREPTQAPPSDAVEREAELHDQILEACNKRGWLVFHGSMAHATKRTVGEPDFCVAMDDGKVLFCEGKSRTGKLTTEQQATAAWLRKLGHRYALVRSLSEFLEAIKP